MHEEAHTDPIPVIADWSFLPHGNLHSHPARRGLNAKTFEGAVIGPGKKIPFFTAETITPDVAEKWSKGLGATLFWLEGAAEQVVEDTTITGTLRGERLYKIHARRIPLERSTEELREALKPWRLSEDRRTFLPRS